MADTAEEWLGKRPEQKQTAEQWLGPKPLYDAPSYDHMFDDQFSQGSMGAMLDAFKMGFKDAWGTKPLGEIDPNTEQGLKDAGIFNDYKKGQDGVVRQFNETLIRPAVTIADAVMRGIYATAGGIEQAGRVGEAQAPGVPSPLQAVGGAAMAGMEAFPAGHFTGLPVATAPHLGSLRAAAELGLFEDPADMVVGPDKYSKAAFQRMTKGQEPTQGPVFEATEPQGPPLQYVLEQDSDVNTRARMAAPEAFDKLDALHEQKRTYQEWIGNLQIPETYNIDGREIPAGTKLFDLENILGHPLSDKEVLDFEKSTANAELIKQIQKESAAVDKQIEDLSPKIKAAYESASAPEPIPPISYSFARPGEALRDLGLPEIETEEPRKSPGQTAYEADLEANPTYPDGRPRRAWEDLIDKAKTEWEDKANDNNEGRQVLNVAQRRPSIATEIYRDLRNAGRPDQESRASASLLQAYYETRAARLGTDARSLFDEDRPNIVSGTGSDRGKLNLASRTISLFQSADSSTFVHETGHVWLEDLLKDAQRPDAPEDLKQDLDAVKGWLQMKAERPSKAQHELFARGFERYLMEGVAPTQRLAGVFEKFKSWLTAIYRTVSNLRAPINDEIRSVFDRLISKPGSEAVIAPDRPLTENLAERHEAAAAAEPTLETADRLRSERDSVAELLRTELNNSRKRARIAKAAGPTEGGPERSGVAPGGGEAAGPDLVGAEPNAEPTALSPSGATFKAEGGTVGDSFGRPADRLVGKDGQPILANIEAPDDIDRAVQAVADSRAPRGTITQVDRVALGDATGIDPNVIDPKLVGTAFNSDEIRVLSRLAIDAETDVWNKMQEATESGDPLELAKSIARLEMIQAKATQAAAEWGRAGQALRAFNEATGGRAADALNDLLKRHSGRSYDELMQLAWQARALPTPRAVGALVHNSRPMMSPTGQAVTFLVTNSYLSGEFTHAAYVIGNQLRVATLPAEVATSGAVGAIRRALNIGPADRVYLREGGAALQGIVQGTRDALQPAWQSYLAGKQQPLPGGPPTSPWAHYTTGNATVDTVLGQPIKVVAAIHQFSRVQFYTQYLYQLSMEQALDEGHSGQALANRIAALRNNPSPELMAEARTRADTAMFQREVPWNSLQAQLARATEKYAVAKVIFPFMKIGFEYARERLKRTPLAPLLPEVRQALTFKQGGAGFDEAVGKMVFGTSILGAGIGLAAEGFVTGAGPSDPKTRSEWILQNKPYSVNIGNLAIPIGGLGYPGALLQFGADLWETGHYAKKEELEDLAAAYTKSVIKANLDEGFFRDLTSINEVMTNTTPDNMTRFVANLAKGFIPYSSLLSQTNRNLIDPYEKDIEPGVAGIFQHLRAMIPGASYDIPNRLDMFGQPIPARGAVPSALDSDIAQRYANDPTVQWLNQVGVGPGRLDRSFHGVRLTEQQYHSLSLWSGQISKEMLDQARPTIERLTHGQQIMAVDRILGNARKMARAKVVMDSQGTANDLVEQAKKLKLDILND